EVDASVENETAHSAVAANVGAAGERRDISETAGAVHIEIRGARSGEIRVVQDVDHIHAEFKLLGFRDFEAFDQIHVEVKSRRTAKYVASECSRLSWLRIDQEGVPVRVHDRL